MAALHNNMVLVGILVRLVFTAQADHGTATFYTRINPSACFGTNTPTGLIAAASAHIWQDGAACRTRYSITCTHATDLAPHPCTGQRVEVEIVDFCPNCRGTFDLSQDAFAVIADTNAGKILIEYDQI